LGFLTSCDSSAAHASAWKGAVGCRFQPLGREGLRGTGELAASPAPKCQAKLTLSVKERKRKHTVSGTTT